MTGMFFVVLWGNLWDLIRDELYADFVPAKSIYVVILEDNKHEQFN